MKNLILLTLILLAACGADDPGKVSYPPSMPPEDEVPSDETPDGPPEWFHYSADENGEPIYKRTRALYSATHIEVFYTSKFDINISSFAYLTTLCMHAGVIAGHDVNKIGVLNGMFKEQGYTKDFLLNPDVERTWSGQKGWDVIDYTEAVETEFRAPLLNGTTSCTDSDGNEATCKKFLCGVDKTPEVPTPPETLEIEVDGETVEVGTRNLYDAERIGVGYSNLALDPKPTFKDMLTVCAIYATKYKYDLSTVGVLNGAGKKQGFTKDFLLDPDVTRTWTDTFNDASSTIETKINEEFDNPFGNTISVNGEDHKAVACGIAY